MGSTGTAGADWELATCEAYDTGAINKRSFFTTESAATQTDKTEVLFYEDNKDAKDVKNCLRSSNTGGCPAVSNSEKVVAATAPALGKAGEPCDAKEKDAKKLMGCAEKHRCAQAKAKEGGAVVGK